MMLKTRIDIGDVFIALLTVTILFFFVRSCVRKSLDEKEVKKDYLVAIGWIVDYRKIGTSMTPRLTYNYFAKWKLYSRTMSPRVDFSECIEDFTNCKDKRFLVLYSKSNPQKSLIDLKHLLADTINLKSPESLDYFK